MLLNYFYNSKSSGRSSAELDYQGLQQVLEDPRLKQLCEAYRNGNEEAKKDLPCVAYMGHSTTGQRKADLMEPTGLVMLDIDHCAEPRRCYEHVLQHLGEFKLLAAHITPSGKGLRLVLRNLPGCETISENIESMARQLEIDAFGDVDTCCKDLSRISFIVPREEWLLLSEDLFADGEVFVKGTGNAIVATSDTSMDKGLATADESVPADEENAYDDYLFNGNPVKDIANTYCWLHYPKTGQPPKGQRHNFYNEMCRNFRNLVDNNPKALHTILPRFGLSAEETWKQCQSFCARNTQTKHLKPFYFFLKNNGFWVDNNVVDEGSNSEQETDPYAETKELVKRMPKLPPVFREYVNTAPEAFKIPMVMSLLPILGTLTSYLSADYIDGETNTTSFITVIYAPPSSGKSFVKRHIDKLMTDLNRRDMVSAAREQIYMTTVNRKGSNEKAPDDPHVPMRVMPPINSQPEFLNKQRNNHGYHMFTYCEEMDTWIKGSKTQGNDKNDLVRIAWDNGIYGQAFKTTGTFKGQVRIYWNVLITGTLNQVETYFKDIENGLITRCSYADLDDQQFAEMPIFKRLSVRDNQVIDKFLQRCDENTYKAPLDFDEKRLYDIKDSDFDAEVPWQFDFLERKKVDLKWIFPHLQKWLKEQNIRAKEELNVARDVFRRRCAVRGFRLALLCYALYPKVNDREKVVIRDFVLWFMDCDIQQILKLWGAKYNKQMAEKEAPASTKYHQNFYEALPDDFSTKDLQAVITRFKRTTNPSQAIHVWKKRGMLEKLGKDHYHKINKS